MAIGLVGGMETERAFVIGNGTSRQHIVLTDLPEGKTYGCNAVYRDFDPDVLVSVDNGMMHEIYCKYEGNAKIYFRQWSSLPAEALDMLLQSVDTSITISNAIENATEFVLNGSEINTFNTTPCTVITWLNRDLKPISIDDKHIEDFSTGTTAIDLAARDGAETIYLLGFDIGTQTDKVNNIYAGTSNYCSSDTPAEWVYEKKNTVKNWKEQHCRNFVTYSNVNFVFVNDIVFDEFNQFDNVSYMSVIDFNEKIY